MAARATTYLSVQPDAVLKRIPPRLRPCVNAALLGGDAADLLVFPPDSRYVVTSKDLRKVLQNRPTSTARLVAIGYDFTQEARELVDSLGGLVFSESSFFVWTDEQWHAIHQS